MERDLTTLRYQAASTGTGTLAVTIEELNAVQRALDVEREKVKRLSTCGTDHSTPWWQVKCEDLEAQLATIQAQLRQVEDQRHIDACCEKPHDCKWGGLGGCGYEGRKYELKQDARKAVSSG